MLILTVSVGSTTEDQWLEKGVLGMTTSSTTGTGEIFEVRSDAEACSAPCGTSVDADESGQVGDRRTQCAVGWLYSRAVTDDFDLDEATKIARESSSSTPKVMRRWTGAVLLEFFQLADA